MLRMSMTAAGRVAGARTAVAASCSSEAGVSARGRVAVGVWWEQKRFFAEGGAGAKGGKNRKPAYRFQGERQEKRDRFDYARGDEVGHLKLKQYTPDKEDEASYKVRKANNHHHGVKYVRLNRALQVQLYEDFVSNPEYYTVKKLGELYGLKQTVVKGHILLMNETRKLLAKDNYKPLSKEQYEVRKTMDENARNDHNLVDRFEHQTKVRQDKPAFIMVSEKRLKEYLKYSSENDRKALEQLKMAGMEEESEQDKLKIDHVLPEKGMIRKDACATNHRFDFAFTDISSFTKTSNRRIVIREKDGSLRHAGQVERDISKHMYFGPHKQRRIGFNIPKDHLQGFGKLRPYMYQEDK
eukprot:Nk52_evm19s238 gene=Nk52_evmTU19s238